jgi:hypothetical protein
LRVFGLGLRVYGVGLRVWDMGFPLMGGGLVPYVLIAEAEAMSTYLHAATDTYRFGV